MGFPPQISRNMLLLPARGNASHRSRMPQGPRRGRTLLHVERLDAGGLAGGVKRDLLDPRLGLAQQLLAAALELFAPLIDLDRFLERNLALFKPLDDRF